MLSDSLSDPVLEIQHFYKEHFVLQITQSLTNQFILSLPSVQNMQLFSLGSIALLASYVVASPVVAAPHAAARLFGRDDSDSTSTCAPYTVTTANGNSGKTGISTITPCTVTRTLS